eukprot:TRINITY_DN11853_c0_g1_i1.p1 TRINITY_DN11853_c0_g1~~TRINITY_DN11853_c0_g1_i1.p1  ORF type:complete len:218 (+),score=43.12 TRINITY_DN11853_c0_g1_i1:1269-1922(+)
MQLSLSVVLSVVLFIIAVSGQSMPSWPTDFTANYKQAVGLGGTQWWGQTSGKMYFSSTQGAVRFDQQQPQIQTELSVILENNTQNDYVFAQQGVNYCGLNPGRPLLFPISNGCNAPTFVNKNNDTGVPANLWFIDGCPGAVSLLVYWAAQPVTYPVQLVTFYSGPWTSMNYQLYKWQITNFQSGTIDPSVFAVPSWCPSPSSKGSSPADLLRLLNKL